MVDIIITIVAFIFMICLSVSIHEFGHFIMAKKFNVYVHEFAIGMGPKIFSKKGKETTHSIRALPIGGYVSMAGEDVNSIPEQDKTIPDERKFYNLKYWKKVVILIAGIFMNLVLALTIYSGLILAQGKYAEPIPAIVTEVVSNSAAEEAGLQVGDKIIKITKQDGSSMNIHTFYDMQAFTYDVKDSPLVYHIDRNGEELTFNITQKYNEKEDKWLIGIIGKSEELVDVTWYNFPYYGLRYTIDSINQFFTGLKMLFKPGGINMMSGPVGIVSVTSEVASLGLLPYLSLIALININLAIVNLLPLPVLDGGQIVLETIKRIIKRDIPRVATAILMYGSWAILLILMLFVTKNDIFRLFIK